MKPESKLMSTYLPYNNKASRFVQMELLAMAIYLFCIGLAGVFLFPGTGMSLTVGFVIIYFLIRIVSVEKVKKLVFDDHRREVQFSFTKFGKRKIEVLNFNEIQIEVKRVKSVSLFTGTLTIYFLKGDVEQFELNKLKDGFNNDTLEEIIAHSKSLSLYVSEKEK